MALRASIKSIDVLDKWRETKSLREFTSVKTGNVATIGNESGNPQLVNNHHVIGCRESENRLSVNQDLVIR